MSPSTLSTVPQSYRVWSATGVAGAMEMPRNPLFSLLFYLSCLASSQGTPVHYDLVSGDTCPLCVFVVQPLRSPSPSGSPELTCGLFEDMILRPFCPSVWCAQSEDAVCLVVRGQSRSNEETAAPAGHCHLHLGPGWC